MRTHEIPENPEPIGLINFDPRIAFPVSSYRGIMPQMFLAGPFKALVDQSTMLMSAENILHFLRIIEFFEAKNWEVHCAHRREQWGKEFMTPEVCTRIDYEQISLCDVFVAFPGVPVSPGTHVEIGWATALRKPTVLLLEKGARFAHLIEGIGEIAPVERVVYTGEPGLTEIEAAVKRVLAR